MEKKHLLNLPQGGQHYKVCHNHVPIIRSENQLYLQFYMTNFNITESISPVLNVLFLKDKNWMPISHPAEAGATKISYVYGLTRPISISQKALALYLVLFLNQLTMVYEIKPLPKTLRKTDHEVSCPRKLLNFINH